MRLVALLAWYDERESFLAATIASLTKTGVDHVVAVDGAYLLYPDGKPSSGNEQSECIRGTCQNLGIGCTVHQPQEVWIGNEVEKRTFMFRLAETMTTEADWYQVIDADEVITEAPTDVKQQLAETDLDVAELTVFQPPDPSTPEHLQRRSEFPPGRYPCRKFFRAVRGLSVVHTHYTYEAPGGRRMWGNANGGHFLEPSLALHGVVLEHRSLFRTLWRHNQQDIYYRRRTQHEAERAPCDICGEPSIGMVSTDWERVRQDDAGQWELAATWIEACATHHPPMQAASEQQVLDLTDGQRTLEELRLTMDIDPRAKAAA